MRPTTLSTLTLLLLTACDGSAPTSPQPEPGEFELSLSRTDLSAPPGGSGSLTVTVIPKNSFDKAVVLSVVGAPAGLKASFAPPASATQSTLTLNVPADLEARDYPIFVKGSASVGGVLLERTAPLKLTATPPPGITVGGRVRDALGQPLPGALIRLNEKTATADFQGSFSFPGVNTPYTVSVQAAGQGVQHEFVGLTRPDPTLVLFGAPASGPAVNQAAVTGHLSGTTFPVPAGQVVRVAFAGDGDARGNAVLGAGQGPGYHLKGHWSGSGSVSGTLYALVGTLNPGASSLTAHYSGFASRDVTLSSGTVISEQNLHLASVQNSALSVKLTLPGGAFLESKRLFLSLGPRNMFWLGFDSSASLTTTYPTPVLPGKTLGLLVNAKQGGRKISVQRTGLAANQVLDLTLPAPVALQSPLNGAADIPQQASLDWSDVPDSVYVLVLGSGHKFIYTASSEYHTSWSSNTSYTWSVISLGPFSSLDDFSGPDWAGGLPSSGDNRDYVSTRSESGGFKTAP